MPSGEVTLDKRHADMLQELIDRQDIRRAVETWAIGVDAEDSDLALSYFSDDCEIDYGPGSPQGPMKGKEAYRAFIAESSAPSPASESSTNPVRAKLCSHHVSNVVTTFRSADEALTEWYSLGMIETLDGGRTIGWSVFKDTLRRSEGGWQIVERHRRSVATQRLA